ncbi:TIGR01212 family radical SAM protein [candidate division KSB1 bacterium]|nr:TIGR01212 family radical SAM protein [candidate division KSB1 bacterium]
MNTKFPKTEINLSHPIYRLKDFFDERFNFPVRKLPVHTYLGCPHRDNNRDGGCIYCYEPAFSTLKPDLPDVQTQIKQWIDHARSRGYNGKFIAYFQTGTNTYAPAPKLKSWWEQVYEFNDDIVGLAVGTRPDCLDDSVLQVLSDIGERLMVWLELGLQSANDRTLSLINRGHDYQCFVDAIARAKRYPCIHICAHIILGLPGETADDMLFTINEINNLHLHGVKIHHLQVVKHTVLQEWYNSGHITLFNEDSYIGLITNLLPHLNANITVHRLVGDIRDDLLIAPRWHLPKTKVLQLIHDELQNRMTWQGKELPSVNTSTPNSLDPV